MDSGISDPYYEYDSSDCFVNHFYHLTDVTGFEKCRPGSMVIVWYLIGWNLLLAVCLKLPLFPAYTEVGWGGGGGPVQTMGQYWTLLGPIPNPSLAAWLLLLATLDFPACAWLAGTGCRHCFGPTLWNSGLIAGSPQESDPHLYEAVTSPLAVLVDRQGLSLNYIGHHWEPQNRDLSAIVQADFQCVEEIV